jgi:hypothetical protein
VYVKNLTSGVQELLVGNGITTLGSEQLAGYNLNITSGTLNLTGSGALGAIIASNGNVTMSGAVTATSLTAGNASFFTVNGSLALSTAVALSGNSTLTNNGTLVLPTFDAAAVVDATIINRGRLDILNDVVEVGPGVTFSHNGTIGALNTIGTLRVDGKLTHERGYPAGVSLNVEGDATIGRTGIIEATGLGLRGGGRDGNPSLTGETVSGNGTGATGVSGGSYAGVGAGPSTNATYGSEEQPDQLGSGGGSSAGGRQAGNGGGRVHLVVDGTLRLDGAVRANGGDGATFTIDVGRRRRSHRYRVRPRDDALHARCERWERRASGGRSRHR